MTRARRPHRLAMYRAAVQHPLAEIAFCQRVFRRHHNHDPLLLREDYCGTAAVADAWARSHPDRQAMAIDHHGPTVRWARRTWADNPDLHLLEADVLAVHGPRVDITCALNFSILIHHHRPALLRYLRHARRGLRPGGLLILDLYGGPGAMRPGTESRPVTPDHGDPFTYHWEQASYDPVTARTRCRIHFTCADGHQHRNAFRYDWRLWTPPELLDVLRDAGFSRTTFWTDPDASGRCRPVRRMPPADNWIGYLVSLR